MRFIILLPILLFSPKYFLELLSRAGCVFSIMQFEESGAPPPCDTVSCGVLVQGRLG